MPYRIEEILRTKSSNSNYLLYTLTFYIFCNREQHFLRNKFLFTLRKEEKELEFEVFAGGSVFWHGLFFNITAPLRCAIIRHTALIKMQWLVVWPPKTIKCTEKSIQVITLDLGGKKLINLQRMFKCFVRHCISYQVYSRILGKRA